MIGMPTPIHILLKEAGQWRSRRSAILIVLMQAIDNAKPLMQVFLKSWHRPIDYGLDLSGILSQTTLPNEAL